MQRVSRIDSSELDPSVAPTQDLYRHVNGRWLAATEIPADRSRWGVFTELAERTLVVLRELLESDETTDDEFAKCRLLYASFMDEATVEAKGITPLDSLLERVETVASLEALWHELGWLARAGFGGLVHAFVDADPGDPTHYVAHLYQGGISLPDERYYREEQFEPIRTAYRHHLERMHELAGLADPEGRADRIWALEARIAARHWDNVRSRDALATYNPRSAHELTALGIDVEAWAAGAAIELDKLERVIVYQPSFLEGLVEILRDASLDELREWLQWRILHASSPLLQRALVEENFAFYGRTLSGTVALPERWKRGVGLVEGAMGEVLGRAYVARYFPPAAKQRVEELVSFLLEAYRQRITNLDWMGEQTRQRALEKLAALTTKIGYPTKWRDYTGLEVAEGDLFGNVLRARIFEHERNVAKLGGKVDKTEWFMTPQTVNAYYNPPFNEIVFPAAILQFPFFDPERDDAENFGAIGAVIGHEIGHAFDDQGSRYDSEGRLANWWTDEDRARFEERAARLVEQYGQIAPEGANGQRINGALTVGENIGDLGGLGIAWVAYMLSLRGDEPPVIGGRTGQQRFFLSWAHVWRTKTRPEETVRLLTIDPHSPPEARCNQVARNLDAFHAAFHTSPGDPMWLDPAERVTIW